MPTPHKHTRKNIRLKGYDYSRAGLYFITICCQGRICRFGHIENGKMILNDVGRMVEKWYYKLENKYPDKRCDEMVVMPNHFHCIIENMAVDGVRDGDTNVRDGNDGDGDNHGRNDAVAHGRNDAVAHGRGMVAHGGAPLRGRPDDDDGHPKTNNGQPDDDDGRPDNNDGQSETNKTQPNANDGYSDPNTQRYGMENKIYNATIGDAIGWFKTMTTNKYIDGVKKHNWERFDKKLWQRNYHEHIIRDEQSYKRIVEYIRNNPKKWDEDTLR